MSLIDNFCICEGHGVRMPLATRPQRYNDPASLVEIGLEECIATLLYCTPRLQADIPELKLVSDQLTLKYKKEYAEACRSNQLNNVNEKVLHRLAATPPPKILVER